ncbi:hypothetical protein E4T51_16183 [Aureobasidium sp. EXF-12344]|nr:hypothetical protein E4T51_16183 [Aureobasidium sp. EXF-12344]
MDIAKFIDQPIRFNPRRPSAHSASKISSLPPSPSYEGTRTSSFMSDAPLSPESRSLPTQNPNSSLPRTPPLLAGENGRVLEGSKQRSATPKLASETCDGKCPVCTACVLKERFCKYSTRAGASTQAARKERLRSYATILELIRDATPEDRDRVLKDFRAPKTLDEAIEIVQRKWVCRDEDLLGL